MLKRWGMTTTLKPRRALVHPLWVVALIILIANDHYLKTAGILPGWLTGKLSDFAGLLVAPAVLAATLSISSRRGVLLAHAAIGAVFTAIKVAYPAARALEALMALTPLHWHITIDPTDLIALPMLGVSIVVLMPSMRVAARAPDQSTQTRIPAIEPLAQRALLMVGSIACMATSKSPEPCNSGASCLGSGPAGDGALVIGNATSEDKLVRLRRLKSTIMLDCDAMMADPTLALSRELFQPAEAWLLQPSRALILENSGECSAILVDADGVDMTLIAWRESEFGTLPLSTVVGSSKASTGENRELIMRVDSSVGRVVFDSHPAIFKAPPVEDPAPGGGCETPSAEDGVAWTTPLPLGTHELADISVAPDGCTALDFKGEDRFYLCVPGVTLPFAVGDAIDVETWEPEQPGDFPEALGEGVVASGLSMTSAKSAVIVAQGSVIARWQSPDFEDYSVEADPVVGCSGSHDDCGSLVVPLEVSLFGGTASDITILRSGKSATLAQGAGTITLIRAEDLPIRDTACVAKSAPRRLFESVLVRTN